MHYRRSTETNFSTDSGLNRPQCNAASLYICCGLSEGCDSYYMLPHNTISASTYSRMQQARPHSLAVVKRHLGKSRKSLTEVEADVVSWYPKNNLCHLNAKLLLAYTELHRLMIHNSVSVSKGGFSIKSSV